MSSSSSFSPPPPHPGGDPFDGGAAGTIGADDLPEEGPEGQPGGVDDAPPGGALLLEDLPDGGLGEEGVEAEHGLDGRSVAGAGRSGSGAGAR